VTAPTAPPGVTDDWYRWRIVAALLFRDGSVGEAEAVLDALARGGDHRATRLLAGMLAQTDRIMSLRARARTGDRAAHEVLAGITADRGWLDELWILADDDPQATGLLAAALAEHGDADAAVAVLRPLADMGDRSARIRLASLLARFRPAELAARAAGGDWDCVLRQVDRLGADGRPAEAMALLRAAVTAEEER
jgi:hypothetical protein